MRLLITGGCGFLGSNLAAEAIKRGDELIVFDNLSRFGSEKNLEWLRSLGRFEYIHGDIRNANDVDRILAKIKPDAIFHLAGQVAMTTSIDDPRRDFEINALGTFNLLNSARLYCPEAAIIFSSTNKVYGDLEWLDYNEESSRYELSNLPQGLPESIPLKFSSPYGCSKGSADQYMLDFSKVFGLNTVVFRHSSMYGGRQFSTYDQGWIGWFCEKAIETASGKAEKFTISGNGKQVRDVLHAEDMVRLYFMAVENIEKIKGEAFNIGGGPAFSLSLLELFDLLEKELAIKLDYTKIPVRESDQRVFIADITKAKALIGWNPNVEPIVGIRKMLNWTKQK